MAATAPENVFSTVGAECNPVDDDAQSAHALERAAVDARACQCQESLHLGRKRGGQLPAGVQQLFDKAKGLERGRRGRCLANMIAPDLAAALAAYEEALFALRGAAQHASAEDIERLRSYYELRVVKIKATLVSAAEPRATFDEACRTQCVFRFDTHRHAGLAATTKSVLGFQGDLGHLHTYSLEGEPPLCPALLTALARQRKVPPSWRLLSSRRKEHIRAFRRAPEYKAWVEAYRHFIQDVVAPLVGDPLGVVFQCPPTVRCQLPSSRPLGQQHRDDQYEGHQGEEINFWLPLTRVWGNNTLHVESSPGKADFRPLELQYGEFFRFDGGQCEHFTKANDTGSTRVSLDFRVIPRSVWRDEFGGRIGDYPCEAM